MKLKLFFGENLDSSRLLEKWNNRKFSIKFSRIKVSFCFLENRGKRDIKRDRETRRQTERKAGRDPGRETGREIGRYGKRE